MSYILKIFLILRVFYSVGTPPVKVDALSHGGTPYPLTNEAPPLKSKAASFQEMVPRKKNKKKWKKSLILVFQS